MPGSPPSGPLRALRALPLWARWVLTVLAYALVAVAIVVIVHDVNTSSNASRSEADAEAEANREGQIAIRQDEAPHVAALGADVSAQTALQRAIATDARARVVHGQLTGPLQSVRCVPAGVAHDRRRPFRCTVESAGNPYPFVAVADQRTKQLTWCKVDPPPTPGAPLEVPVSASCRA